MAQEGKQASKQTVKERRKEQELESSVKFLDSELTPFFDSACILRVRLPGRDNFLNKTVLWEFMSGILKYICKSNCQLSREIRVADNKTHRSENETRFASSLRAGSHAQRHEESLSLLRLCSFCNA